MVGGFQHLHEEGVDGRVPDELEEEQVLQALQADGAQGWEAEQQLGKPAGKPKGRQEPGSAALGSYRHRGARPLSNLGEDREPGRATEAAGQASVLGSISSSLPSGPHCAHTPCARTAGHLSYQRLLPKCKQLLPTCTLGFSGCASLSVRSRGRSP